MDYDGTFLGDFDADAQRLDLDAFIAARGRFFLVCQNQEVFDSPEVAQATQQISLGMLRAALNKRPNASTMVLEIRRKKNSPFRFMSVGRTPNCDIVVPEKSVSKLQAIIREDPSGDLTIEGVDSPNPTLVDSDVIPLRGDQAPTTLRDGMLVSFGRAEFVVWSAQRLMAAICETPPAEPSETAAKPD